MNVAVIGAGGPAGVNVCRALQEAGHTVTAVDVNELHLKWAEPFAERLVLDTGLSVGFVNGLGVEMMHSQPEQPLLWLADMRDKLEPTVVLPDARVIALCQDKFETGLVWRRAGIREDRILLVQDERGVYQQASVEIGYPFWLRARHGAGARGSALVHSESQALHWLGFWQARDPQLDFVAEEFLPGRDFCWTSLWYEGEKIASFARERLEWLYPHLAVSGRTGTPTVCRIVHDRRVNETAEAALLALDPAPHGLYAIDLREDKHNTPRPTECNAGRFPTTSPLYSRLGVNLADLFVECATGKPTVLGDDIYPDGVMLLRHIDCPTVLI